MRKTIISLFIVFIMIMGAVGTIAISPIGSVFDDVDMGGYVSSKRESQPTYTSLTVDEQIAAHKAVIASMSPEGRQSLFGRANEIGGAKCSENPDESSSFSAPYYWEPAPGQYSKCYENNLYLGQDVQMFEVDPITGGWSSLKGEMELEKGQWDCFSVTPGKRYAFIIFNCVDIIETSCTDTDGGKDKYTYGYVTVTSSGSSNKYYDSCLGSYRLSERYCDEHNTVMTQNYECSDYNMVCENGKCVSGCSPIHDYKKCFSGHSYWYDSCDQRNDLYAQCSHGCENGACLSAPVPSPEPTLEYVSIVDKKLYYFHLWNRDRSINLYTSQEPMAGDDSFKTTVKIQTNSGKYFGDPSSACKNVVVVEYDKTYIKEVRGDNSISVPGMFMYGVNYDGSNAFQIPKCGSGESVSFDLTFVTTSAKPPKALRPIIHLYDCVGGSINGIEDTKLNMVSLGYQNKIVFITNEDDLGGTVPSPEPTLEYVSIVDKKLYYFHLWNRDRSINLYTSQEPMAGDDSFKTTVKIQTNSGKYFGDPSSACKNVVVVEYDKTYIKEVRGDNSISVPGMFMYGVNYDGSNAFQIPKCGSGESVSFDLTFVTTSAKPPKALRPIIHLYDCVGGSINGIEDTKLNMVSLGYQNKIVFITNEDDLGGTVPSTDPLICNYCEGNTVKEKVISGREQQITLPKRSFWDYFKPVSRTASIAQTCEEVTSDVFSSTSNHQVCLNGEFIANPKYFQPKVVNMWVKHSGEFVKIEGTSVPYDITKTWEAGKKYDVVVEVDNSGSQIWAQNVLDAQEIREMSLASRAVKSVTDSFWGIWSVENIPGVGSVIMKSRTSNPSAGEITDKLKQNIDGFDWINIGILEIGFYANSVADQVGYGYSRGAIVDYEETIRLLNACQGEEDTQGWKQTYALLLAPKIAQASGASAICREVGSEITTGNFDAETFAAGSYSWGTGAACNIKVLTQIKVPESGDVLADNRPNFDPDGKYVLHAAIVDRCWRPSNPQLYTHAYNGDWAEYSSADGIVRTKAGHVSLGGTKVQLDPSQLDESLGDYTCCQIGSWFFGLFPDYRHIPLSECRAMKRGTSGATLSKCKDPEFEMCYRYDDEDETISKIQLWKGDCKKYGLDWTTDYELVQKQKGNKILTKKCFSCSKSSTGDFLYEMISPDRPCSEGYHENEDFDCSDPCEGNCAGNEVCDFGVCKLEGDPIKDCDGKCNLDTQDCLKQKDGSHACITRAVSTEMVYCYGCDENSDPPFLQKGKFKIRDNNKVKTCAMFPDEAGKPLLTLDYAKATCKAKLDYGTAFINPNNKDEWCIKQKGMTSEESCAKYSFPRKEFIEISEISKLSELSVGDKTVATLFGKDYPEFYNDKENPLCVNKLGDVMCMEGSICLPAKEGRDPDKNQVYETLSPIVMTWADYTNLIGLAIGGKKEVIEKYGVCTFKEQDPSNKLKRSIADMFGWDADDEKVTYVIIAGIFGILALIIMLSKPSSPKYISR